MNRTQTLAVAVLVTLLPFAQTAFASDRDRSDRGRSEHARGHGHDRHHGRDRHHDHYERHNGHYHGHHYCNEDHHYRHYQSQYNDDNQYNYGSQVGIRLPFPPLPPFPVIVLKKHHQ